MKKFELFGLAAILFLLAFASKALSNEYDFVYDNDTILKDTTWSGKVLLRDILTVSADITLTIEPGTVIMFEKRDTAKTGFGENEIYIQGEVVAVGTKDKPIIFTSAEKDKKPGDWVAINMMISEDKRNIFKNCILEYSLRGFHAHFSNMNLINCEIKNNFLAVQFQDSTVTIKDCNIHDNNQGIQFRDSKLKMEGTTLYNNNIGIRSVYNDIEFTNNKIQNCTMTAFKIRGSTVNIEDSVIENCKAGITAQDTELTVKNSMILNNLQDGLSLHNSNANISNSIIMLNGDDGILIENTTAVINNNNIFNNAKYNVTLEQSEGIDARHNFWGTDDVEKIDRFNYDKKDLSSAGEIDTGEYFETEIKLGL